MQIKSLLCCRYTTTPCEEVRAFEPRLHLPSHLNLLRNAFKRAKKKSLGVELNHRFRLIRATCFRYTTERFTFLFQSVGMVGIEPTVSCSQDTRAPGALHPEFCSPFNSSGPYGSRTHLPALKGRYPRTDRRTSPFARTLSASGSGGARILVSWFSARC